MATKWAGGPDNCLVAAILIAGKAVIAASAGASAAGVVFAALNPKEQSRP